VASNLVFRWRRRCVLTWRCSPHRAKSHSTGSWTPRCGGTRLRAADRRVRPHRSSRQIRAHIAWSEVCVHDARACGGALGDHPLSLLAVSVTPVRFNLSHSRPLGFYRLHPPVRPLTPRTLVVVDVPGWSGPYPPSNRWWRLRASGCVAWDRLRRRAMPEVHIASEFRVGVDAVL
jgi:hypothetical protein